MYINYMSNIYNFNKTLLKYRLINYSKKKEKMICSIGTLLVAKSSLASILLSRKNKSDVKMV